jgi:regulator of sigma D
LKKSMEPITLSEALATYTKYELDEIRRRFNYKGISQLNKRDLVVKLAELLRDKIASVFMTIDQERYEIIKEAIKTNGYYPAKGMLIQKVEKLCLDLIFFPIDVENKPFLVMPTECMSAFKSLDSNEFINLVKRNTNYIKVSRGLLYHYGVLQVQDLMPLVNKNLDEPADITDYIDVIGSASSFYEDIQMTPQGLADWRVEDADKIYSAIETRCDLDFYPYTKEQIIQAGEEDYIDFNEPLRELGNFLAVNYHLNDEEIHDLLEEYMAKVKEDYSLQDMTQIFLSEFEVPSEHIIERVIAILVSINNKTSKWTLKGYAPFQLRQRPTNVVNLKEYQKTGRNQPCPCGSGKKYKQCCGK